jgi:CRP-like cAMP-binding protein
MVATKFKSFLTSNLDIEAAEISSILKHCKARCVKKEEFLLHENELSQNTFFVEKGLLRQFSIDKKGKEHTLHFAPENWFVTDRESAYFNQPSKYYIQALECKKRA